MSTEGFIKKYYIPSVIVCSVLLILATAAGVVSIARDSKHYIKYKSDIEIDAHILVENGIEWNMLDDDMPTPKAGDKVKIISVYQPVNDRHTNKYSCSLLYFENGKPVGYANGVDNSQLKSTLIDYAAESAKSNNHRVTFHRGITEQTFFAALLTIISMVVYAIFNLPILIYLVHKDYYAQSKYATAAFINIVLILAAAAGIIMFL